MVGPEGLAQARDYSNIGVSNLHGTATDICCDASDVSNPMSLAALLNDALLQRAKCLAWEAPRYTYFACGSDGAIKIGSSCRPKKRAKELRDAAGERPTIVAVIPAGFGAEWFLHAAFASDALGGEWFKPSERLNNLIALAAARYPHLIADVPDTRVRRREIARLSPLPSPASKGA